MNTSASAQRPSISPKLLTLAITPAITSRSTYSTDHSDKISPPILLPLSPIIGTVAWKPNSFKHRHSFDATPCDKPTISVLQNKNDEHFNFAKTFNLKTAPDISSETVSLLSPILSSSLLTTSSAKKILKCESEDSQTSNTLTCLSPRVTLCIIWDQNRFFRRLHLIQDQRQIRSLRFCVNTHNLTHLLLKIFLPLFLSLPLCFSLSLFLSP